MKKYAQILKSNMEVNLVGGTEVGLPVENHKAVFCIEINDETDVKEGMLYDEKNKKFIMPDESDKQIGNPDPIIETTEQKIDRLEKQMQQDNLVIMEVLATMYEEILSKG